MTPDEAEVIALAHVDDPEDADGFEVVVGTLSGHGAVRAWRTTPFVLSAQTDPGSGRWVEPEGEPGGLVICTASGDAALPPAAPPGPCSWAGERISGSSALVQKGTGLLTVFMQPVAGADEEFNAWYDTEHLPPLSSVPGVLSATRFRARYGSPAYLAVYELSSADVGRSRAWQDAGIPTPWTQRIRKLTTDRRARLWTTSS